MLVASKNSFRRGDVPVAVNARRLNSEQALQELMERSNQEPVFIFKHSATCPISAAAMEEFSGFLAQSQEGRFAAGYLIVQEDRPISNTVAEQLGVKHESPQAILVKDGRAVWHASHWNVTAAALKEALAG